jgi:hypothetical protein
MAKEQRSLDELLVQLEFPGEEEGFRREAEDAVLTERVMRQIPAERSEEREKAPWSWIGAILGNLILLMFFGIGDHPSATLILETGDFFSSMIFLSLGLSTSVSLAGAVLSLGPGIPDKLSALFAVK